MSITCIHFIYCKEKIINNKLKKKSKPHSKCVLFFFFFFKHWHHVGLNYLTNTTGLRFSTLEANQATETLKLIFLHLMLLEYEEVCAVVYTKYICIRIRFSGLPPLWQMYCLLKNLVKALSVLLQQISNQWVAHVLTARL